MIDRNAQALVQIFPVAYADHIVVLLFKTLIYFFILLQKNDVSEFLHRASKYEFKRTSFASIETSGSTGTSFVENPTKHFYRSKNMTRGTYPSIPLDC